MAGAATAQVKITPEADRVRVEIEGKPYTDFIERGGEAMKPYLWPLSTASGKVITRHFPMEVVEGEPKDHPHQRGLWFAHDRVNGVDFWNNEASYNTDVKKGNFTALMTWSDPEGKKLLNESRITTFIARPKLRIIDFDITLTAATKVVFGDSKDGVFGIRLNPALQEDKIVKEKGKPNVTLPGEPGTISNAEGQEHEKSVWGKPSNWVDYTGNVDGQTVGVAMLDHPSNAHRARWHVRAYGLFAANPFGLSAFTGDKSQNGDVTLEPGQTLHFRYRVVIHEGDAKAANIAKLWDEYSK